MTAYPVVLYVEDDLPSADIMNVLLTHEMALEHVTILEDSDNFVRRVHEMSPPPEIILLDIHVRPFNGFEMLGMLRAMPAFRAVPVVALTASVMNEEVERLRQAGFNGVIAKPVDIDLFPTMVERILRGESVWHIFGT
jgi:CheY-like chemotaxis protein